jgi:hypothetical protein
MVPGVGRHGSHSFKGLRDLPLVVGSFDHGFVSRIEAYPACSDSIVSNHRGCARQFHKKIEPCI